MYIVVIVMIMNILSCDLKKLSNMKPTVFFGFLDFFFLSIAHWTPPKLLKSDVWKYYRFQTDEQGD